MSNVNRVLFAALLVVAACGPPQNEAPEETIARGAFVDKGGQTTTGSYQIVRTNTGRQLVLSEDFATNDGPDLHVALTPTVVDTADNGNVMVSGTEILGPLQALAGTQSYDIPTGIDLSAFGAVIIHCVEFTHLYGAAPLTSP